MVEIANFLKEYGWMGVTILLIVGGMAQVYVFRWQYKEKEQDAIFWRDRSLNQSERLDKALDTLDAAIKLIQERTRERDNRT